MGDKEEGRGQIYHKMGDIIYGRHPNTIISTKNIISRNLSISDVTQPIFCNSLSPSTKLLLCHSSHKNSVLLHHRTHDNKKKLKKLCLNFFLFFYSKYLSLKKSLTCSFRRNREIFIMTLQKNSQQLNSLVNMFRI